MRGRTKAPPAAPARTFKKCLECDQEGIVTFTPGAGSTITKPAGNYCLKHSPLPVLMK